MFTNPKIPTGPPSPRPRQRWGLSYVRFNVELKDGDGNGLLLEFGESVISTKGDTLERWIVLGALQNATVNSLGEADEGTWRFNRDRTCIILSIDPIDVFALLGIDKYPRPGHSGSARYIVTPPKHALKQPIYWEVFTPPPGSSIS